LLIVGLETPPEKRRKIDIAEEGRTIGAPAAWDEDEDDESYILEKSEEESSVESIESFVQVEEVKMATPKKKKTPTSKCDEPDDNWDLMMSGLSLSEHQQSTFYVAGFIPCVVTPMLDKEKNPMVSIDMQCFSGVQEDSYEFAVSDCRRLVYIDIKPSPVFTNSSWLETLDEKYDAGSARQQTFSRAVEAQKGQDKTQEIVTRVQVKVPFKIILLI